MNRKTEIEIIILGLCIFLGLAALGMFISGATQKFKMFDRSVTVKGLSEREYMADIVIWPIQFVVANNDLTSLYSSLEEQSNIIREFLLENGVAEHELSVSVPSITDKSAQSYGDASDTQFRYVANQIVTVYSADIEVVRQVMKSLSRLGKKGSVFSAQD